jgi:hypothetical protein
MTAADEPLSIILLNQNWFADELRALGCKVISVGWSHEGVDVHLPSPICTLSDIIASLPVDFSPDRLVYFDNSRPCSILGFESLSFPAVFFSIDTHHHNLWHRSFAELFDHVLVAQKDFLSQFPKANSSWFPLWLPVPMHPQAERPINVCFRGNLDEDLHPLRATFFKRLQESIEIDAQVGPYQDAYARSRIVINQTVKGDFNFRVFEALGAGALLVTPSIQNGLIDLYIPGQDLVT